MTRRIVLAILAVICALLGAVVIPLGLITARHDRQDFRDQAVSTARSLASVAEEKLGDHESGAALTAAMAQLRGDGDQVAVYGRAGRRIAGAGPPVAPGVIRSVLSSETTIVRTAGSRLLVLAPVRSDEGRHGLGAVALSRPAGPLGRRLLALWAWLGAVSAAGLLVGALVAIALARWVSRPLSSLAAAARRLGDGALDTRSDVSSGPGEVRRLAANFNTMAGRLEALVDGHRAMMADVSHQLRTPLAALRLRLDLLAQDTEQQPAGEIAGAQDEIARLSRLVDGLLAVARAENVVTRPVPIAVDEVISDRAAAWRPAAEEHGIEITASCPGPLSARLAAGHLEQILDNLLANAFDAVPPGSHVRLRGIAAGPVISIVVEDDGPGMSESQREVAFRRFFSATPGGSGLGLAIVHRLVTSNGGLVRLSDTPGGGLTVTLELPAGQPHRGARRAAAKSS
jgi:signal transduction histidine kinase